MCEKKTTSQREDELVVLASMIADETKEAAAKICVKARLKPATMFTDPELRDNYDALKMYGVKQIAVIDRSK